MISRRGGVTIEREVSFAGSGLIGLRQRFSGSGERIIVTHDASLEARVQVLRGRLVFAGVAAPASFVLSVPPRSTVRMTFEDADVDSDGVGRMGASSPGPAHADGRVLDADAGAPAAVARARAALHEHLSELAPVRAAAAAAGLNAETLTRAFAKAYGLTPKQYCTRARLFDAAISLFTGVPIVSAALASGFNDLSRFYAQFRRVLHATPGEYARAGNREDAARNRA